MGEFLTLNAVSMLEVCLPPLEGKHEAMLSHNAGKKK